MAKKNWGLIILGIVIFAVIVGAGIIGTFGYIVYRQMDVQAVTLPSPDEEFAKALAAFEGKVPFIELPAGFAEGAAVVHREQMAAQPTPLTGLRVLAWDPQEQKLVRLLLPMWLLRLSGHRGVNLSNHDVPLSAGMNLNVTADELERHGPGLILDFTSSGRERVLVWAE
jgi:hypothetical protein